MSSLLAMPPMTLKWLSITAAQAVLAMTTYPVERMDPAPYSKFAAAAEGAKKMGPQVPSRVGMLIIYTPALMVAVRQGLELDQGLGSVPGLVAALLFTHFLKRVCEVLFLHRYSGGMPLAAACMIGIFYALTTLLENVAVRTEEAAGEHPGLVVLGGLLFVVGEVGNFYHHWLLATLRRGGTAATGGYQVPQGGLFTLVNSPHYFFELVAWYGIAAVARQLNVLLVAVSMTGYLAGRSVGVTEWYQKSVPGVPASRRHLVPCVF